MRPTCTLTLDGPGYPTALRDIPQPPATLNVRGRLELLSRPGIAVIGTRVHSVYGRDATVSFVVGLVRAGYTIVSGLARGIDGIAHRTALEIGGDTIGVLGTGLDVPYPLEHEELIQAVAQRGCLVSEFAPGTPPRKYHFPQRNRIIAGLSRYAPAGGIISTMEDMARWIAFRLNDGVHEGDQLISREAIKEIREIRIPTSFSSVGIPKSFIYPRTGLMGTGFGQYTFEHRGNEVITHNGGWMYSVIEVVPQENLGVGLFSNAEFSDLHPWEGMAFVNAVALIVIDHYLGYDYVDWSSEMLETVRESP